MAEIVKGLLSMLDYILKNILWRNFHLIHNISVWMPLITSSFNLNGVNVNLARRSITFSNTKLPFVPDVFPAMDTLVMNGI